MAVKSEALLKTGIGDLDDLLLGGIPQGDIVLVSGSPGTGKTNLCLQLIYEGAERGESGIYVTLDSDREFLIAQARGLGMDLGPLIEKGKVSVVQADPSDLYVLLDDLRKDVKRLDAKRLVVDSLSILAVYGASYKNLPEDLIAFMQEMKQNPPITLGDVTQKQTVYYFIRQLRQLGITTFLISELPRQGEWYSRDTVSEFAADGILLLDQQILGEENVVRTISIPKMRRSLYKPGVHECDFKQGKGFVVKKQRAEHLP